MNSSTYEIDFLAFPEELFEYCVCDTNDIQLIGADAFALLPQCGTQ